MLRVHRILGREMQVWGAELCVHQIYNEQMLVDLLHSQTVLHELHNPICMFEQELASDVLQNRDCQVVADKQLRL